MSLIQSPTEDFKEVNQAEERPTTPEAAALRHLAGDMFRSALGRGVSKADLSQVEIMGRVLNVAADMIDREAMASTLPSFDINITDTGVALQAPALVEVDAGATKEDRAKALFEAAMRLRKSAQLIEFKLAEMMGV